ncbi:MAG TPA: Hsp70 family protein, partial [Allocoleopsis sp.]
AVALGAAIQAGMLGGEVKDLLLLDVTPLSIGIETLGEVFTKIIDRNTTIPTSKSQIFSTATDGQTSVEIHVLQGERAMAKDNKSLGKFLLAGLPAAPRGLPQIEVSFEIDVDGIMKVTAQDKGTGVEQSIVITNTGGLNQTQIEKMRQEAELYADEDRKRLQISQLKNQAETLFYSYQSTLKQNANVIGDDLKTQATQKINKLRQAFGNPNSSVEQIKQLIESFQQTVLAVGAAVYQQVNQSSGSDFGGSYTTSTSTNSKIKSEDPILEVSVSDYSTSSPLTQTEEVNFEFDDDDTVTADYEAVD